MLAGYKALGGSIVEHELLGKAYVSDFEYSAKEGTRRVRELVAVKDGQRIVVTCSSTPDAFEKNRPAFERALATFHVVSKGPAPESEQPRKPAKPKPETPKPEKPGSDEPF